MKRFKFNHVSALAVLTGVVGLATAPTLLAQGVPFTYTGTSPTTFQMDQYGTLSAIGNEGAGTLGLAGAGSRMFWYPAKAAFRAGKAVGTEWDDANIGQGSVAMGINIKASGNNSVALGNFSIATGSNSVALGWYTWATGSNSFAAGGPMTFATGTNSVAIGGPGRTASGNYSTSFGGNASGVYSFSTGAYGVQAEASYDFAIGSYNVGGFYNNNNGNTTDDGDTQWIATDPIFEIGNGTYNNRSNALTVYKNGNMKVGANIAAHGTIRCNPGGDISMGTFTAGTAP